VRRVSEHGAVQVVLFYPHVSVWMLQLSDLVLKLLDLSLLQGVAHLGHDEFVNDIHHLLVFVAMSDHSLFNRVVRQAVKFLDVLAEVSMEWHAVPVERDDVVWISDRGD
jgi:hypothetical protein